MSCSGAMKVTAVESDLTLASWTVEIQKGCFLIVHIPESMRERLSNVLLVSGQSMEEI